METVESLEWYGSRTRSLGCRTPCVGLPCLELAEFNSRLASSCLEVERALHSYLARSPAWRSS